MRLKRLAPERLEIAREEYAKLANPVVKELLGEYCSFEWVMYRATEPTEFWKRDLSADVVRQKMNRAIFYVLRDMLCESFVNFYGATTGPTETSRVVQWASLEASHILHKPDEVDAEGAAYEIDSYPRRASSYLGEDGLKRVAEKLGFEGDPDSLAPALDELYPDPSEYDYDEEKEVDIEQEIDAECLFYFETIADVKKLTWMDSWDAIPQSPVGYLLAGDEEKDILKLAPIRPTTPLCNEFDHPCRFTKSPTKKEKDLIQEGTNVLDTLGQAIGKGYLVRIRYVDRNGEETDRLIRPDALQVKTTGIFLKAYCTLREDQRTFSLARIREAVPTNEPAPADDLEQDAPVQVEQKPAQAEKTQVEAPKTQNRDARPTTQVRTLQSKDNKDEQELNGNYDRGERPIKKDGKDTWATGFVVMLAALYILANIPMFAEYKNIVVAAFMGLQVLWFIFIFTRKEP